MIFVTEESNFMYSRLVYVQYKAFVVVLIFLQSNNNKSQIILVFHVINALIIEACNQHFLCLLIKYIFYFTVLELSNFENFNYLSIHTNINKIPS